MESVASTKRAIGRGFSDQKKTKAAVDAELPEDVVFRLDEALLHSRVIVASFDRGVQME